VTELVKADTADTIGTDSKVTLHFALKLADDGALVDSNFDKAPATFVFGDGSLLPNFERKLLGLKKGASAEFTVLPEEAFGQPNPNNVQVFKRAVFAADMDLHEGLVISFADASKAELPGVIKQIGADQVTVDFNHPLAGHTLIFSVRIVEVAPAAADNAVQVTR
jgi:FKBP-type peptidyl-prolyl cis-trans isomerase SlpA